MTKIRLLVTCVGGFTVPTLLDCLDKSSIFSYYLVGVDSKSSGNSRELLDSYYQVPNGSDNRYIEKILDIVKNEKIEFILPGSDEEAICISKNKKIFNDIGVKPIVSNIEVIELITNKYNTYMTLAKKGVRVPKYKIVNSIDELRSAIYEYGYPDTTVISKPVNGRGGRGLYVFEGNDSPPAWLGSGQREKIIKKQNLTEEILGQAIQGDCLVMPALTTPSYDADVVAVAGVVKLAVVRERVNPAGIPFQGNKIHSDTLITQYCQDIATALDLDSIHDIDLMTDQNGEPCIIEVNPRPSGSMAATLTAGIPVVDIAILTLRGMTVPNVKIDSDIMILPSNNGGMEIAYE
jgi:carbamoylphosphate synthase large subunit